MPFSWNIKTQKNWRTKSYKKNNIKGFRLSYRKDPIFSKRKYKSHSNKNKDEPIPERQTKIQILPLVGPPTMITATTFSSELHMFDTKNQNPDLETTQMQVFLVTTKKKSQL